MKKIYTLVGCALITGAAIAQAPYQYATSAFTQQGKYAPGAITVLPMRTEPSNQDRTVFYSEDFDGGYNGWDNDILAGPGIFQGFELTNIGHINSPGNTFIIPDLMTSTPTQWIMVDSDGGNTSYSNAENAILTSQRIDLSSAAGEFVALQFDQFFAEWDINVYTSAGSEDHCYIYVSTDSVNWTAKEINEGVGREARPNPEQVSWDITDYISGNLDSVWIRFEWEGAWNYGWQIDNIAIVDIFEYDLAIIDTYRWYNANGLMFSQVPMAQAEEFQIGTILRNVGHEDQVNVEFDWEIKDPSNAVVSSGTATSTITLANSEQDTLLINTGFIPTDLGTYTITWTASSTSGDDNATNDVYVDNYFELTEYTYAMDYAEGSPVGITEWPTFTGTAEFGNLFSFAQADEISAVQIKIANNTSNIGTPIYWTIYYNDGTNGWLYLTGSNEDYELTASDIGEIITLPVPGGESVDPANLYLVVVGQYDTPTDPIFERQGSIGFDYIQGYNSDPALMAFFDRLAPIVRIRVNADEVGVTELENASSFSIYPNPVNDVINVNLSFANQENISINVLDITGKVVKTIYVGEVNGDRKLTIGLDELTSGIYFVELVTPEGKQVQKFVKK